MLFSLSQLIKQFEMKIKGVIHVGAFDGDEAGLYREAGILRGLFFEPQKHLYEITKQRAQGYRVENMALGNYNGTAKLNVSKTEGGVQAGSGASSSILEPALHKTQYPNITFEEVIEVPIGRLDDYLYDNGYLYDVEANQRSHLECKFNFLNIDVQGYELEVLKGASHTLFCIDYILCEVNRAELYKGCPMVEDIIAFLARYDLKPAAVDWSGNNWGDMLFVSSEL